MTQYNTIAENEQYTVVSEYKAEIEARWQQHQSQCKGSTQSANFGNENRPTLETKIGQLWK